LSVVMALKSLERSQVALLVLDASEGLAAQDAHIAGYAHEAGRAIVVVVNKWDLVPPGMVRKAEVVEQIRDRLPFLDYAPVAFTSALRVEGVHDLFELIDGVAAEARRRVAAGEGPARRRTAVGRGRVRTRGVPLPPRSAAPASSAPPPFALRVNQPDAIPCSCARSLAKSLRHGIGFSGSPPRVSLSKAVGPRGRTRR